MRMLDISHIRHLHTAFSHLADQASSVTREQVTLLGDVTWEEMRGRGRGRITQREGEKSSLQLFLPCRLAVNNIRESPVGQFRNYRKN